VRLWKIAFLFLVYPFSSIDDDFYGFEAKNSTIYRYINIGKTESISIYIRKKFLFMKKVFLFSFDYMFYCNTMESSESQEYILLSTFFYSIRQSTLRHDKIYVFNGLLYNTVFLPVF
jgi:hypothetical protein